MLLNSSSVSLIFPLHPEVLSQHPTNNKLPFSGLKSRQAHAGGITWGVLTEALNSKRSLGGGGDPRWGHSWLRKEAMGSSGRWRFMRKASISSSVGSFTSCRL